MGVQEHRSLLKDIGVDVDRHAKMMEMGLESYKAQFMTQKNRPEAMKYFDWFMSEMQGQRIAEINELRKKKNQLLVHFVYLFQKRLL